MDFLTGAAAHRYRELRGKYVATPFVPEAHPSQPASFDPSECFLRLPGSPDQQQQQQQPTCESGEQILDGMIVEFSYASGPTQGGTLPAFHPARWRPLRVRWDKTEEHLLTGKVKANNLATAGAVWRSIHSPISREILSDAERIVALAGRPAQQQTEYYVVAGSKGSRASADDAIRTFHNHGIKRDALLSRFPVSSGLGRSLFDFGCGRGGDLGRWLSMGAERIVGIDKYASNLYNPDEDVGGAHVRVLKQRMQFQNQQKQNQNHNQGGRHGGFPRIAFLPMDGSLPLSDPTNSGVPWTVPGHSPGAPDGASGGPKGPDGALTASAIAETDRKVAAVLWGRTTAEDARRLKLGEFHGFASAQFDLATCMFALHYFFDARKSLATFAANVGRVLRPGGHFAGCCLDGALVDALLAREAPKPGDSVGSAVGTWRVTRRYSGGPGATSGGPGVTSDVAFGPDVAFGRQIDVRMASIGQEVPEYLVDYATLVEVMAKHGGLVPVNDERARALGLVGGHSTGLFEQAHEAWEATGGAGGAVLSDDDKKYSFLHRWFVFVKAG
jgi:SAM-dependent methyltransferase